MTAEQQIANILEAILPLVKAANNAAFALETVAHLRAMEKQVLPYAEALREAVKGVEDAVTPCAEHGSPAAEHGTLEQ
jgi:hypothetical protein